MNLNKTQWQVIHSTFLNTNDGYDATRILNESLLQSMREKISGDMVVAVPHQDVLIIADIVNEIGYDIIAQMTMKFFCRRACSDYITFIRI